MLVVGISAESGCVVDQTKTAQSLGSGDMPVFATPAMVALMENAALSAVQNLLEAGSTTVGTSINVSHIKPSAIGEQIVARAVLTNIEGRKLTFSVSASDSDSVVGEGVHTRFIVERDKFLNKIKK